MSNPVRRKGKTVVENFLEMRCPKCGNEDKLDIQVKLWTRVCDDGMDEDAAGVAAAREYQPLSPAICRACDHLGTI
jgi:hypothetical protein